MAARYTQNLEGLVKLPIIKKGYYSSWAQYSILLKDEKERNGLQVYLKEHEIPSMIYYPKTMHQQRAFQGMNCVKVKLTVSENVCQRVLALPLHPYLEPQEQDRVISCIEDFMENKSKEEKQNLVF